MRSSLLVWLVAVVVPVVRCYPVRIPPLRLANEIEMSSFRQPDARSHHNHFSDGFSTAVGQASSSGSSGDNRGTSQPYSNLALMRNHIEQFERDANGMWKIHEPIWGPVGRSAAEAAGHASQAAKEAEAVFSQGYSSPAERLESLKKATAHAVDTVALGTLTALHAGKAIVIDPVQRTRHLNSANSHALLALSHSVLHEISDDFSVQGSVRGCFGSTVECVSNAASRVKACFSDACGRRASSDSSPTISSTGEERGSSSS
jgi:hypothetical protein